MIITQLGQIKRPDAISHKVHAPAADTAAVITLTGVAGSRHVIDVIHASYSATPTGGGITIVSGVDTILSVDIPDLYKDIRGPFLGGVGETVVITLAAGSGTVVGKVNATTFLVA